MTVFRILPSGHRRRLPDGSVRALGASGSRYFDVAGSTQIGVDAEGLAIPLIPMAGQTWLTFALSGSLTQSGTVGYSQLSIGVAGALSSSVNLRGASLLGVNMLGNLTPAVRLYGNTGVQFAAAGRLLPSVSMRGLADLGVDTIGQLSVATALRGRLNLGINVGGLLTAKAGQKWRDMWRDVYEARQTLLNAIDANNRYLAKSADGKAEAAADAVVQTNVRVEEVEDGLIAESQRVTLLTGRVTNTETQQTAQGTAISNLQTTQTQQGDTLSSHSSQLVSVQSSISTLDGKTTTNANATQELDARVTITEAGVTQAKASWGVYLTAGNLISGVQSINNGTIAEFNVAAHVFRLLSPAGADGMEIQNGYIRVWKGSSQRIIGNGFGANNDLMDYFGPNVGVANASKSNAIMWMDQSGNAYWGGSLSAGVLKNAAQSSQISASASVEVGPFGTNGNQKVVTWGVSFSNAGFETTDQGNATLTGTIVLERSLNAGSTWTQISSLSVTGNRTSTYDHELHRWDINVYASASGTFTDNTAGTSNFMYRVRITATSGWPLIINNGSNPASFGTQRLYIQSVEQ